MAAPVDVSPLYHPEILRHARAPRLRGTLEPTSADDGAFTTLDGYNRACGDRVHLHLGTAGTVAIRFEAEGCQLSLASASAICEAIDGLDRAAAAALVAAFRAALADPSAAAPATALPEALQRLLAVRDFPARVACVRLAPDTLAPALGATP